MKNDYLVIESHVHLGNSYCQDFLEKDLLKRMDETGQDMAIIMGPIVNLEYKWRFNYYGSNDYIAEVQRKYPSKFIGIATINPWYQSNKELSNSGRKDVKFIEDATSIEIERCVLELGLKGFKFHATHHGYSFNDPILMPPVFDKILEVQKRIGKPLYNIVDLRGIDIFSAVEKFAVVAESYHDLFFAASHCGDGLGGESMIKVAKKNKNIILDVTNTIDIKKIKSAVKEVEASRIVAGSDECYFPLEVKMDIINLAISSDEDKKLILGGNLQKFFDIK